MCDREHATETNVILTTALLSCPSLSFPPLLPDTRIPPLSWLRGYLFNNSYRYFMQRINNAFDHPLSVADAATPSSLTSSQRRGFTSTESDRCTDRAGRERIGAAKHEQGLALQPSCLRFIRYGGHVSNLSP